MERSAIRGVQSGAISLRRCTIHRSFPRKREGGFTFEVQHFGKGLSRGPEVKALARGIVVSGDERVELSGREGCESAFARQEAAHSTDSVLDPALLPGSMRVTEIGQHSEPMQPLMASEL